MASNRPADACPYRRPLPEGFDACPLFNPVRFVVLDTHHQPLRPVLTCRHMEAAADESRIATYYLRCTFGDAGARRTALRRLSGKRLALLREVAAGVNAVILEHLDDLTAAKTAELQADTPEAQEFARGDVVRAARELVEHGARISRTLLASQLEELGMEPEQLDALVAAGADDYVAHGFDRWTIPDSVLEGLPRDVAAFLKGEYGTPDPPAGGARR